MTPPVSTIAVIPAPVPEESTAVPLAPVVKPDFRVVGTRTKSLYVVEPPPMPGLPPVEGAITLIFQSVADPGLPEPPAPVVIAEDPASQERFAEAFELRRETRFAFVSATVYDRSRTRITCHSNVGHGEAVTAWSNIDFNHMAGLGNFEATRSDGEVRSYYFLMGIGNESTGQRGVRRDRRDRRATENDGYVVPVIPALPDGAPAFVIVTENPHPATVGLIEDIHALYRTEGKRLARDAAAREKAYQERKAGLLANPPKPKDVTVRFWKRDKSAAGTEGGRP